MNFNKHILLLTGSIISVIPLLSIAQTGEELIQQIIESIASQTEEQLDYTELASRFNQLYEEKIDINLVSYEELQGLLFLNELQIQSILKHRNDNGNFVDVLELQSMGTLDVETIRWLSLFLVVKHSDSLRDMISVAELKKAKQELIVRLGQALGPSSTNSYAGSPLRVMTRYRFDLNKKLLIALNMEKDAGEELSFSNGRGFDFYSGSVTFRFAGRLRELIIGDYSLQFGEGLSLWSGLSFGKGANALNLAKPETGLRPYTSLNENSYFRGIAGSYKQGPLTIRPFLSFNKIDASLTEDGEEINSIQRSGLHRTESEIRNKNSVGQLSFGTNLQYQRGGLKLGGNLYHIRFGKPLTEPKALYQRYNFKGASLNNLGVYYKYTVKNFYMFGELAHTYNAGVAYMTGLLSSLSNEISVSMLYRNYGVNYQSLYSQAFSEASQSVNERGVYTGILYKPSSKLEWNVYADVFQFPWLKYRVDAPSKGFEVFSQVSYLKSKSFRVSGRYRIQSKAENSALDDIISHPVEVIRQNFRIELNYKITESVTFRQRAEMSVYVKKGEQRETGFLQLHDLIYNPMASKISGNIRIAFIDTQGFNSRIYAYENDVLYGYAIPGLQGKGLSFYVNTCFKLGRNTDLWLKYSLKGTLLDDFEPGVHSSFRERNQDLKFQVRQRF